MITAIRKNLADFLAIIGVVVLGIGIGAYILVEPAPALPARRGALLHGQGRAARRPGRHARPGPDGRRGRRARGRHRRGRARGRQGRRGAPARAEAQGPHPRGRDARSCARRPGTKDMFLEVDPGDGQPLEEDGRIQVSNTLPDIDPDEFLAVLDSDTRNYLKLLISGAGKGLDGRGTDLREVLKRLGPLHKDLARVTRAVAERRQNMRRLVNRYGLLMTELGKSDEDITRLVRTSNVTLGAFADEDQNISALVSKLPGTLNQTATTLGKVDTLAQQMGPTFESLRPPFRKLDEANAAVLPFVKEAAPILQKQVRPFVRAAQPFQRDLGAASEDLAQAGPDLTTAFRGLNRLFNIGAYNPGGTEGISEQLREERRLHARGARAQRELPLLARLGRPEHRVAVLDGRRARPDPARLPAQPELRHLHLGGAGGRHAGRRRPRGSPICSARSGRARSHDQADPQHRPHHRDGRVHALGVRDPDLPLARVRRLGAAQPGGLPLHRPHARGGDARRGGRRADGRRERRQGEDEGARRGRRAHDRRGPARRAVRADPEGHARDPPAEDAARRDLPGAHAGQQGRRHARRRRPARQRPGRGHGRARRDLHRVRPGHAPGVQGLGQGARRRDQGRPRPGPERRVRQLRGLRGRRREAHAGARRAERRRAPARQEHRRRVRGDQRAPRRAARPDRQLEAHLRGHRVARRGARRDVRDLPDLPRRDARRRWRGSRTSRAPRGRS